jgi:ADP-heptose:LPS heptosyltransferase
MTICPGGNWDPKRWPVESFAKLADILEERFGVRIVISGTRGDIKIADDIRGMMKHCPIIACGWTTLKQAAALFERSALVVANDTGTMHLAVAMKANVIALFGPTSPALTGPYGAGKYKVISKNTECIVPCYDLKCKVNRCMQAIKVEDVLKEAESVLIKP